jgi:hypothetical protein
MKRGSPLRRKTPLRADPQKVMGWQRRSRKRLKPQSDKRAAGAADRAAVREQVFERDHYRCQWPLERIHAVVHAGGRMPNAMLLAFHTEDLTYHHLRKASAGGEYSVANGLTLCSFHNSMIEDFPIECELVDLVIR